MVRKGDQTAGDMRVVNAAKELVSYTLDRTNDRNIFPKSQRGMSARRRILSAAENEKLLLSNQSGGKK